LSVHVYLPFNFKVELLLDEVKDYKFAISSLPTLDAIYIAHVTVSMCPEKSSQQKQSTLLWLTVTVKFDSAFIKLCIYATFCDGQ